VFRYAIDVTTHQNTLRRWKRTGFINAALLPNGVRRFRDKDIKRLHLQNLGLHNRSQDSMITDTIRYRHDY
jgi:DNA-binding transcriptional MerR regulator